MFQQWLSEFSTDKAFFVSLPLSPVYSGLLLLKVLALVAVSLSNRRPFHLPVRQMRQAALRAMSVSIQCQFHMLLWMAVTVSFQFRKTIPSALARNSFTTLLILALILVENEQC